MLKCTHAFMNRTLRASCHERSNWSCRRCVAEHACIQEQVCSSLSCSAGILLVQAWWSHLHTAWPTAASGWMETPRSPLRYAYPCCLPSFKGFMHAIGAQTRTGWYQLSKKRLCCTCTALHGTVRRLSLLLNDTKTAIASMPLPIPAAFYYHHHVIITLHIGNLIALPEWSDLSLMPCSLLS